MVSSALRRHKERQKEIERDEKKRRELKEGIFISDGTEEVAEEKVTITETEQEHLARKKKEILDRNAKLSEIERRVRSSGNFGAHTAKEKGYSHKERHTMEYWASSDPELMARQEESNRCGNQIASARWRGGSRTSNSLVDSHAGSNGWSRPWKKTRPRSNQLRRRPDRRR